MAPLFKGVSAKTPANSQQGSTALESLPADLRGHRSIIYDLFELYQDEVRGVNGFDLLDLVFHIWTQVFPGPSPQSLYARFWLLVNPFSLLYTAEHSYENALQAWFTRDYLSYMYS